MNKNTLQDQRILFQELIACQICYCRSNHPAMCPHCSKIYCHQCISSCLGVKDQCPNCRRSIRGRLGDCRRFVNQLSSIVGGIFQSKDEMQRCGQHGISLNYYCLTCRKAACCQCKMFGDHQTHEFKPINAIYQQKYASIRELLSWLKTQITQKQSSLTMLQNHLIAYRERTQNDLSQLQEYSQKYRTKLQQNHVHSHRDNLSQLSSEVQKIQKLQLQIKKNLQKAIKNNCYKQDPQIMRKYQQIVKKNQQVNYGVNPLLQQAVPQFYHRFLYIQSFSQKRNKQQPVHTPKFDYQGSVWKITIYPGGNRNHPNYLSVFAQLLQNPDQKNFYELQIILIHPQDPRKNLKKHHCSKFSIKQSWGYAKFIYISELYRQGFLSQSNDKLQVQYGVKFTNYYDLYKRREMVLEGLNGQISRQKEMIEERQGGSRSSIEIG